MRLIIFSVTIFIACVFATLAEGHDSSSLAIKSSTAEDPPSISVLSTTYVINLKKRTKRYHFVAHQLHELKIPFQRFEAIDLGNGDPEKIKEVMTTFYPETLFDEATVRANLTALKGDMHFTWGAAGCWQSHLQIYLDIIHHNLSGPFMILEDDVKISPRIHNFLSKDHLFSVLPADWEMLLLDHSCLICHDKPPQQEQAQDDDEVCLVKFSYAASAYVLRNVAVARKLVAYSNTPYLQIADGYVNSLYRDQQLKAYASRQKVVAQARSVFSTDIKLDPIALKTTRYNETIG